MSIPHEHPTNANDPNRGLNVKLYLTVVGAAVIVIAIVLAIVVGIKAFKPTPQTTPTSQLSLPGQLSKPTPLHPILEASVRRHVHPDQAVRITPINPTH
jgi:hypothetical protein